MRKIDLSKRGSAAGRQMSEEFGNSGIPYVRVYDVEGNFVADGHDSGPVQVALGLASPGDE